MRHQELFHPDDETLKGSALRRESSGERTRLAALALATLCSRFPVGSVRVARRATATVESLQSIVRTGLVRTCIHGC